jgi:hypothetical protein
MTLRGRLYTEDQRETTKGSTSHMYISYTVDVRDTKGTQTSLKKVLRHNNSLSFQ